MGTRCWVLACAGTILAACGAGGIPPVSQQIYPPHVYEQRISTNDVSIYWRCTPASDSIRFEGVVQNTKGCRVKFVELELAGADARDRYISDATTALSDAILQPSQISPFAIQVKPTGAEGRYDLFYQYQIDSAIGGDTYLRFRALDVCSPRQHRFAN
jgi:hypothetical protein